MTGLLAAAALLAAPVGGASPADVAALRGLGAADARVARVAYRVQTGGLARCPRRARLLGVAVHSLSQYQPRLRPAARQAFGLGAYPVVLTAVEGAPAAALRADDQILAIGRTRLEPATAAGPARHAPTAAVEQRLEAAAAAGPVRLAIQRGAARIDVRLTPAEGCASRVQLVQSKQIRASADGTYVTVTSALLDFVRNDDELAFALAHEVAHNALGHRPAIDAVKEKRARYALERQTEFAADRLALAMLRDSGYNPARALPFLDRLFDKVARRSQGARHLGRTERTRHAEAVIASLKVNP